MKDLAADIEEVDSERDKRWVRKRRRDAGLDRNDASAWHAYRYNDRSDDQGEMVALGGSPGDVIYTAELYASGRAALRQGTGYWILDRIGGGDGNEVLRVTCSLDEQENA